MSNYARTTFYVGVTNNLERRVTEHKRLKGSIFTSKYKLTDLVYYEEIFGAIDAIEREKQIKNRPRQWKMDLIKQLNPEMLDLTRHWDKKDADLGQHDTSFERNCKKVILTKSEPLGSLNLFSAIPSPHQ